MARRALSAGTPGVGKWGAPPRCAAPRPWPACARPLLQLAGGLRRLRALLLCCCAHASCLVSASAGAAADSSSFPPWRLSQWCLPAAAAGEDSTRGDDDEVTAAAGEGEGEALLKKVKEASPVPPMLVPGGLRGGRPAPSLSAARGGSRAAPPAIPSLSKTAVLWEKGADP